MFWTFDYKGENFVSWGRPRSLDNNLVSDLKPNYDVEIYDGRPIERNDKVLFSMQGDATLGMGDSFWLMSFIRDVYRIKAKRRSQFYVSTSGPIANFYSNFLPGSFNFISEFITTKEFNTYDHILPSMYYWKEEGEADKSWVDNCSILERLYGLCGIEYMGLPDFGEFTNESILFPPKSFYDKFNLHPNEKYVFFQWHSSGVSKNLPPKSNVKVIKHLSDSGYKVCIIGRLKSLDGIEKIKNVQNFSGKTTAEEVVSLAVNAELIVCPDSAGLHLGEAFGVPTVAIMSVLPPVYVASKYNYPAFMYGSGSCNYKPCGIVSRLPLERCPTGTKNYCAVLEDIDLELFDKCVKKTNDNVLNYRNAPANNFYASQSLPIVT